MVEKEFNFELLKDFGKDQFCELDVELKCSLDGEQDFASVEFPIPTEIHVFQEIVPLDIPVFHEEIKEEIACSESEECFESEKVVEEFVDLKERIGEVCDDLKEFGKEDYDLKEKESEECFDLKEIDEYRDDLEIILEEKECDNLKVIGEGSDYCYGLEAEENVDEKGILEFKLDVFEKDPEKEILPTRDKLNILEEIKKKRNVLRSKMKEAKIMRMLRFEIPRNDFGKDFECGFLKRKITGRFFLGVRRCLNFEKLVTLIRVPKRSKNFLKETDRQMLDVKPMKVLQIVSVTKQDVIQVPKDVEIEKDWKKRKRKQEKGLVESVSVTEFLTIGVRLENFHRRSGSLNRVGLENPMITLTLTSPKSKERSTSPPK
uniref:Candidate secreted effector n=1 Tax=Meloidogyne incognita TaxID=6306 RepID=A0A914N2G6_MELIC